MTELKSKLCRLLIHAFEDPQMTKLALTWRQVAEEDAARDKKRKRDGRSSSLEEVFGNWSDFDTTTQLSS